MAKTLRRQDRLVVFFLRNGKTWGVAILELAVIAMWAMWVGRDYLNLNPQSIPAGREFLSSIQTHHLWVQFQRCGWCAVWNGSIRGGYPAFADIYGSMLHPLVMLTTLVWGVINGSKIALVVTLWVAGLAQWWLAHELEVGWLPRMWSALTVVAGGYLAGRMELGVFGVVLSTAMASLVFPAAIHVARGYGKRAVVLLALATALTLLAGQGYIQIGLLAILPAFFFLLFDESLKLRAIWRDYALAAGLALLLAAPFLVPFLHFYPNFGKDLDPAFKSTQPLAYLPLNLVINDINYYKSTVLGKFPYPYLYTLFIGWVPVILAVFGLSLGRSEDRRRLYFLGGGVAMAFLIASAVPIKWMGKSFPVLAGIRNPPLIAGLAVPPILGLAAYGLDRLLDLDWPGLSLQVATKPGRSTGVFSLKWLLLIPLLFNLRANATFAHGWLYTTRQGNEITQILSALKTPSLQWVEPPFGEHFFIEPAVAMGLKVSPGIMAWYWKDRPFPVAALEAVRGGPPPGADSKVATVNGVAIYARRGEQYAEVVTDAGRTPCTASGSGGWLEVKCNAVTPGRLIVKENVWSGWKAWRDGAQVPLLDGRWIETEAPQGEHAYLFRYLPWDVPLGLFLFAVGGLLCLWLWVRPSAEPPGEGTAEAAGEHGA
ncbi:MAG: hypothetical protein GXP41_02510 [Chloroflexi bacterium]|nr:hypothetical protein [Chloroflexota bacterium]